MNEVSREVFCLSVAMERLALTRRRLRVNLQAEFDSESLWLPQRLADSNDSAVQNGLAGFMPNFRKVALSYR
tara:strand:+ start:7225 stop:7440 length:216 start_codon:yes stop_codon:yes gene_type:complete